MKKPLASLLLGWLLAAGAGVPAASASTPLLLQDLGNLTYDPNTGLEWLDLSLTAGQSYNSVLNGWNGYTTTQGFRFATRNEVLQLFTDAGATSFGTPTGPVNPANLQAANLALSLLGITLAQTDEDRSWMFYVPATEPTLPNANYVPSAVFGEGVIRAGYPPEGFFMVPGIFPTVDYSAPEMASALVRVVPEPSPIVLLVAGLGLTLLVVQRTRLWN